MFKGGIGWPEVLIILAVLLLLFGAKRLPEMGRSLGKSMREFKSATKGLADDVKEGLDDEDDVEITAGETATPKAKGRAKDRAE
jgi:sec-independent protein translocase protein TatA